MVSELCSGGELYDRVIEKTKSKEGHFSEFTAARIIKNILSAIQYCHDEKQIVHRDLVSFRFDIIEMKIEFEWENYWPRVVIGTVRNRR